MQASSDARTRDASHVIEDGEYEVVVTEVAREDDEHGASVVTVELAIASGSAKGTIVYLRNAMEDEPIEWLGLPGHLRVVDGVPMFRLDAN